MDAKLSKLLLDRVLSLLLLIGTMPLVIIGALLVKMTSPGPALYSQTRLGKSRQPFLIYKLRTMQHNCENGTGACWCMPGDSRITAIGLFLRRTHIDELPQLWNVLKGDMSLVGPRPERPEFVIHLEQVIPHYAERMTVLPGLTGLAQLCLPPDTDLESVRRKLRCDLHYLEQASWVLDLRLIVATVFHVLHMPPPLLCRLFYLPDHNASQQVALSSESPIGLH